MSNEKYCKFVSSRGIAYNCNIYPKEIISDTRNFNINDYKNIKNGDTVYVISSVLDKFITNIFPELLKNTICITLVTGACVNSVPNELSKLHKINYLKFAKSNKKYIKQWYTQNCDEENSDYIKLIPLGIDYHTLQKYKLHAWGKGKSPLDQEKELLSIKESSKDEIKKTMTFSYYHFRLFERHNRDRYIAKEHLKTQSFNVFLNKKLKRCDVWKEQLKYHFVVSPHGNGLDCHRTWEAIMLGCIPIVKSSSLNSLFYDLPVLIINEWDELNEELLIKTLKDFSSKKFNMKKLTLNYWTEYLNN